ncbi:hypothetical protein L0F63_000529 [Massospora cicadina]|nr:hypothetical protein L0F63_000529 [Massospora cicadina]
MAEKYIHNQAEFEKLTERQRMVAGYPYKPSDPELIEGRKLARELTYKFNTSAPGCKDERDQILRKLFGSIKGDRILIEPDFRCDYGYNIHIGLNLEANFNIVMLDCARIDIGDRVLIGPSVQIYTATHPVEADLRLEFELAKPITIGDDVWIGGNATICPGVIVTKNVPDDVVVAGNPAKIIRRLTPPSRQNLLEG